MVKRKFGDDESNRLEVAAEILNGKGKDFCNARKYSEAITQFSGAIALYPGTAK